MSKPLIMIYEDFKLELANLINNSGLPVFIIESVLQNYLSETRILMQKQYQFEKTQYERALQEAEQGVSINKDGG